MCLLAPVTGPKTNGKRKSLCLQPFKKAFRGIAGHQFIFSVSLFLFSVKYLIKIDLKLMQKKKLFNFIIS